MKRKIPSPWPGGWLRWFVGALSIVAVPMYGQQLSRNVIGAGGALRSTSGTSVLSTTIGQAIAGSATIQLYESMHQGFWLPLDVPTSVRADLSDSDVPGQVYPNPFDAATTVRLPTHATGQITVTVRDLVGGLVRTLLWQSTAEPVQHVVFDGRDASGRPLASGTYVYQALVTTPGQQQVRCRGYLHVVR